MAALTQLGTNCGMGLLTGLYGRTEADLLPNIAKLVGVSRNINNSLPRYAAIVFSDRAGVRSGGSRLAKAIKDNKLGLVTQSEKVRNNRYPDKHKICIWYWVVDYEALKKWEPKKFKVTYDW